MPSGSIVFEFLDKLLEQTRFGNVQWVPTDEPYEWQFRGTEASVLLTSVDRDGQLPVQLSVHGADGTRTSKWQVSFESSPDESAFDTRVRELFALVTASTDPVASLVRDLDNMPPF